VPDLKPFSASDDPNPDDFKILRKGSVYNIVGPYGREFGSYKSASVVGPRWEELTHTPWPYESSAYTPGIRLWELGLIQREHVGMRKLLTRPDALATPDGPADRAQNTEITGAAEKTTDRVPESPPEPKPASQPPRQPAKESKPRQHRLMFQENWDDYREPITPDGRPKPVGPKPLGQEPAEGTESDSEDD
jgi:hypothetical protein